MGTEFKRTFINEKNLRIKILMDRLNTRLDTTKDKINELEVRYEKIVLEENKMGMWIDIEK